MAYKIGERSSCGRDADSSLSAPAELEMTPIELELLSTRQSVAEADVLTRRRNYWLRTVLSSIIPVYIVVPSAFLGWFGLRGLIPYIRERNWLGALLCAGLAAIPPVLAVLIAREARSQLRSKRARYRRVRFALTEDGISGTDAAEFSFADAWDRYAGFHIGRYVIVCPRVGSPVYLGIPTEGLSAAQREEIRALLSRHLQS